MSETNQHHITTLPKCCIFFPHRADYNTLKLCIVYEVHYLLSHLSSANSIYLLSTIPRICIKIEIRIMWEFACLKVIYRSSGLTQKPCWSCIFSQSRTLWRIVVFRPCLQISLDFFNIQGQWYYYVYQFNKGVCLVLVHFMWKL